MTTSPKLARKRFAQFDRPLVARMGTVLNSNVAPNFRSAVELFGQFDHNSRPSPQTLVAQTYRGSLRYQMAQHRLAAVLSASLRSCHTRLICPACDCKASQIRSLSVETELPLPCNEASFGMSVAWRHRCRARRCPQMMNPISSSFP